MATFSIIRGRDAPPASASSLPAVRRRNAEYDGHLSGPRPGEVRRLVLAQDEHERAATARLHAAARRLGIRVNIWRADGATYFREANRLDEQRPPPSSHYQIPRAADDWQVRRANARRVLARAGTKAEAIATGQRLAQEAPRGRLTVHRPDGSVEVQFFYEAGVEVRGSGHGRR